MSKRKVRKSAQKVERRPRGEIDRNYFFGDVFIKTGVALGVALALIGFITPFSLMGALRAGMTGYVTVMVSYALVAVALYFIGRHLRKEATHWEVD